jgi:hypothetical protein
MDDLLHFVRHEVAMDGDDGESDQIGSPPTIKAESSKTTMYEVYTMLHLHHPGLRFLLPPSRARSRVLPILISRKHIWSRDLRSRRPSSRSDIINLQLSMQGCVLV